MNCSGLETWSSDFPHKLFKHTQTESSQFWFMHANPIDTSGSSDTDWREYMALKWGQSVCPHDLEKDYYVGGEESVCQKFLLSGRGL